MTVKKVQSNKYKEAGVDIDLAGSLLKKVKKKLDRARRPEMLAPIGGFGGLFDASFKKYRRPVLVSSIDGIGTKLMVAQWMDKYDTLGYDIVNHCVNDIGVQGAEPLYFMDYIGIGRLRSPLYERVLGGIASACADAGCALLGGETAEMPGMYGDDLDIVGVITGIVEKDRIIDGSKIKPGDLAVGLPSNGLHTNGYSLARHILFDKLRYSIFTELKELGGSIGDALLKPHTSYLNPLKETLKNRIPIHGIAHITGGGVYDNIPRILPSGTSVLLYKNLLPIPEILSIIVNEGGISEEEAYRVFNMGIGMVWFLDKKYAAKAVAICKKNKIEAEVIGEVTKGQRQVFLRG